MYKKDEVIINKKEYMKGFNTMNIKVKFFEQDIVEAIGAGIYQIDIEIDGKSEPLYIGESVFILVRCATHLYELKKNPEYLGIRKDKIKDDNIVLKFNLIELEEDEEKRKDREVKLIKERKPLTQSGVSDFQKKIEDKISAVEKFLKNREDIK